MLITNIIVVTWLFQAISELTRVYSTGRIGKVGLFVVNGGNSAMNDTTRIFLINGRENSYLNTGISVLGLAVYVG